MDAYLFVPRNVGLNRGNYSRDEFYADVTPYMRLDAQALPLEQLADQSAPASPLYRLWQAVRGFRGDPRVPPSQPLVVPVKLYAYLFGDVVARLGGAGVEDAGAGTGAAVGPAEHEDLHVHRPEVLADRLGRRLSLTASRPHGPGLSTRRTSSSVGAVPAIGSSSTRLAIEHRKSGMARSLTDGSHPPAVSTAGSARADPPRRTQRGCSSRRRSGSARAR